MKRALGAGLALALGLGLLAPTGAQEPKARRLGLTFRAPEARFEFTTRLSTTVRTEQGAWSFFSVDEDLVVTDRHVAAPGGKVVFERRFAGAVTLSDGGDVARWRHGDPPGPALRRLETSLGPIRRGMDYEIDPRARAVRLLRVLDAQGKETEATDQDRNDRQELEEAVACYADRPAEKDHAWTIERMVGAGRRTKQSRRFEVASVGRYLGRPAAFLRVQETTTPPADAPVKVLESAVDREEVFDLELGLLARVAIDSKTVQERTRKGKRSVEDIRFHLRIVLEESKEKE